MRPMAAVGVAAAVLRAAAAAVTQPAVAAEEGAAAAAAGSGVAAAADLLTKPESRSLNFSLYISKMDTWRRGERQRGGREWSGTGRRGRSPRAEALMIRMKLGRTHTVEYRAYTESVRGSNPLVLKIKIFAHTHVLHMHTRAQVHT